MKTWSRWSRFSSSYAQIHHHRTGTSLRAARRSPSLRHSGERVRQDDRAGARGTTPPQDFLHIWQDMCAIREFETDPQRDQDQGRVQGRDLQPRRSGAPLDRAGSGRSRHGVLARRPTTTSSARIAATARSWPRDFPPSATQRRRAAARSCRSYRDGALLRPVEKRLQRGACSGLAVRFFVYGAYSEIFARETGFNRGLGRLDARLLRAVRDLSEQRDRRRLGLDRAWRGALQARQPQAGHRRREHRRRVVRLRPGLGRHHVLRDGPVPHAVGSSRSAAACRSSSTA